MESFLFTYDFEFYVTLCSIAVVLWLSVPLHEKFYLIIFLNPCKLFHPILIFGLGLFLKNLVKYTSISCVWSFKLVNIQLLCFMFLVFRIVTTELFSKWLYFLMTLYVIVSEFCRSLDKFLIIIMLYFICYNTKRVVCRIG